MKNLNILTLVPDIDLNQDEIYDNIINRYYQEMKENLDKLSNYKNYLEVHHSQIIMKKEINIIKIVKMIKQSLHLKILRRIHKI